MKRKKGKTKDYNKLAINAFILITIITLFVLSIYLIQLYFYQNLNPAQKPEPILGASSTISPSEGDITFWKRYLSDYPLYFPGWLRLAELEFENGNQAAFFEDLEKAEKINPNSKEVKELKFRFGIN